jgi:hypothetical protein
MASLKCIPFLTNPIYLQPVSRKLIVIYLCLLAATANAQIVNMEGRRFESPRLGWQGNIEFGGNYTKIENSLLQFSNRFLVINNNNKRHLLFMNDVSFVRANGANLVNSAFQHIRYIKQGDSTVFPEAFIQTQFNQQLAISFRMLSGGGLRFRVYKDDKSFFYMGYVLMYEYEKNPEHVVQNNLRLSSYASIDFSKWDYLPVTFVAYLQPKITDINDYRISIEASLLFKSTNKYSFRSNAKCTYDSDPPPGINPFYSGFNNSIVFMF